MYEMADSTISPNKKADGSGTAVYNSSNPIASAPYVSVALLKVPVESMTPKNNSFPFGRNELAIEDSGTPSMDRTKLEGTTVSPKSVILIPNAFCGVPKEKFNGSLTTVTT